ncbi:hypothetical protein AB3329_01790 [Streptococcus sp. H31]|uniref:beta-sandwich lipoprotein n=1 Tax=Streptococcus huangxiaojuni TaxID=3237239 RepID=UPI0034A25193
MLFKKKLIVGLVGVMSTVLLVACSEADRVSENLSLEADNFNTVRKVTVIDAITNDIMFEMSGRMSIKADTEDNQLEILVEDGNKSYQKHIVGLSDNVSYIVQDVTTKDVSRYKYIINFNPKMWIPAEIKTVD